ncbi:hypothetical protein BS50DRAFT_199020 [Corynespora cassiicola Philippines]|uniref:Uncharacterized protein n=1 Tax=Corynespora cassiicola Philippines TaxID=1448308 RepID=A0A2T2N5W2_CORCC|nr:hypothetical protein BS50DRAFT_199020 [Corynespora cassiicola Philippines]
MVYITPELFGSEPHHSRYNPAATSWGIMTDAPLPNELGKRKRRTEEDQGPSNYPVQQRPPPPAGRLRLHGPDHASPLRPTNFSHPSDRRPVKQLKRLSPKLSLVKSTSHLMDTEPDPSPSEPPSTSSSSSSDLRPCHACNSAPKRKRDLENFLECARCDERTCYICARACVGGCEKAICKKCVVEVGQEGDPWCLDCYSRSLNS